VHRRRSLPRAFTRLDTRLASAEWQIDQQQESIGWSSNTVDFVMSQVGSKLPDTTLEGLVAYGSTGALELSESQAHALAQQLRDDARGELSPEDVRMYYREAVAAAVEEANALVTKAGVEDIDSFYRFMEANHRSELHEIRDSFARGDGRPLVKAAKDYVASRGAGVDAVTAERLLDRENTVNGGRIYRAPNGTVMVQIDGAEGPMTLAQAIAGGHVKVSRG
jgi:hypothetical protein